MTGGHRFMCMGRHDHEADETAKLRQEVQELREEVSRLKSPR
jgi:hypothetical protein